jgi:hypothetical protein
MAGRLGLVVSLVFLCTLRASAGESGALQCAVNEERVWMYDSLENFNVAAKLKCGEQVEVIGQENGYVKIRTAGGMVGFVPDKTLPNVPPLAAKTPGNAQPMAKVAKRTPPPQQQPQQPSAAKAISETKTPAKATLAASNAANAQPKSKLSASPASPSALAPSKPKPVSASAGAANMQRTPAKKPQTPAAANSASTMSVSAPAPAAASAINVADNAYNSSAGLQPAPSGATHTKIAADPDEEEDTSVKPLEDNSACQIYFSAYGLSPSQYKWLSQNRRKSFPNVCPAPSTAMVDFVIIFTHDVDFYNVTMPTTVHIDKNGFSDFTPLTTVDTAVISPSDADKNHREYVWVFHTTRGAFDPANFSAKRRPLFWKSESNGLGGYHAGGRTVEDALGFIEGHGGNR